MRSPSLISILWCCLTLLAAGLPGAVFELTNGDRLTGEIVAREADAVIIETTLAGEVRIPLSALATPPPQPPEVAVEPPPEPPAETPEKPPRPTNTDQAAPPGDPAAEFAEARTAPTPPDERRHTLATLPSDAYRAWMGFWEDNPFFRTLAKIYPLMEWDNSIELGLSLDYGENDTSKLDLRFTTNRRVRKHQTRLQLQYEFDQFKRGEGKTDTTRDWLRGNVTYRYDYVKAFFAQTTTRYERRLEKDIYHQVDELLGLGYRWLDTERMQASLTPSAGFGYRDIGDDEPEGNWLISFQQDFSITLTDRLKWHEESLVTYELVEGGQFRAVFKSGLENRLNSSISLNVRYELSYDQSIPSDTDQTTQGVRLTLGAKF